MLMLTQSAQANSIVSIVSLPTLNVTEQHELSWFIDRATLSQDGKHMVHPSEHPAYQLRKSHFDGSQDTWLVSNSYRIAFHQRIPGTDDLVFSAYLYNLETGFQSLSSQTSVDKQMFNSSVMDYLPSLKHQQPEFAFVSKHSGQAEIWLANPEEAQIEQLTHFDIKVRFYQLQWSPNDQHLLALTHNELSGYDDYQEYPQG